MQKIVAIFLLSSLFLSGCTKTQEAIVESQKKPEFFIQTYAIGKKVESYSIEKPARLTAGSAITLAAESIGEVTTISVKEGQKIKKGSRLISLKDTINSYDIRLAQAENTLTIQDSSIESTRLSLDRAITDTQIAYEQAKKTYDTLLAKNALIYDSLVNTNKKTLEAYSENYKTYLGGIESLMTNFLYEGDKILGISSNFEYTNDAWQAYLGARAGNSYADATNEWNKTYGSRGEIRAKKEKGADISAETIKGDLETITNGYNRIQKYVDAMIFMIQNDVIGGGLPQVTQDGWLTLWNGIKTQVQTSEAGFNTWKSQTLAFFNNYQNTEKATQIALMSLGRNITTDEAIFLSGSQDAKLTFDNTRVDLKDKIKTVELALKQAESARDNARKNKELTLNQLSATRNSSDLALEQAKREYSKLAVIAPFDGTVTKVSASVGQRTNMGTPLIEIASNVPEIVLDIDGDIANSVSNGDLVTVNMNEKIFTGTIIAVSRNAGANLLYTTRISVPSALGDLGSAVNVVFTLSKETISPDAGEGVILPLKSVKIISEQEGEIALLGTGNTISHKSVKLGRIVGEGVEIIEKLDPSLEIILTDISNYESEKYTLTKKN